MDAAATDAPSRRAVRVAGASLGAAWLLLSLGGLSFDRATQLATGVLVIACVIAWRMPLVTGRAAQRVLAPSSRAFVAGAAAAAALGSYLLASGPMRGRPLSIDAVIYLLQARALSHGHFGVTLPEPHHLFGGRFLFEGADGRLHGVFPPGFPLFLAPFVWLGAPMLAGPVVAALLVVAQAFLGRAVESGGEEKAGLPTRLSLLLSLPSFARAVETADLLSHAFAAVLATGALGLAITMRTRATARRALALGALLGWLTAARLLDGLAFSAAVAAILLHGAATRRVRPGFLALPVLGFLPFAALVLAANHASSGSAWVPTQTTYFARSDWPSTCHRLGFGWDVGCAVEHGDERVSFGRDGYGPIDALRIVRERAGALGGDLLGLQPLLVVGVGAAAVTGLLADAWLGAFALAFTLVYGLFYYGNAPIFGARHLFPLAPALWWLLARAATAQRTRAVAFAVLAAVTFAAWPRWLVGMSAVARANAGRIDLRGVVDRGVGAGLVVTGDDLAWFAAFDPSADGPQRLLVRYDGSGLKDLRRAHPGFVVHSVLEGEQVQTQTMATPPPGLLVELERTWPSFVHPRGPNGPGSQVVNTQKCCRLAASGDRALFVFEAKPDSELQATFTAPTTGRYALHVEGLAAPDYGTWSIFVDDQALPPWDGYAPAVELRKGAPSAPVELRAGRHTLTFRCTGKAPASAGYLAAFDVLVGTP